MIGETRCDNCLLEMLNLCPQHITFEKVGNVMVKIDSRPGNASSRILGCPAGIHIRRRQEATE